MNGLKNKIITVGIERALVALSSVWGSVEDIPVEVLNECWQAEESFADQLMELIEGEVCIVCGLPIIVPHQRDYIETSRGRQCMLCVERYGVQPSQTLSEKG